MSQIVCSLTAVRIERLRGFNNALLRLDRDHIFLVGPNNAGKSSLLRVLHWAMDQADMSLLQGRRRLSEAESDLLLPAAETSGRARRVTLFVSIPDGRRQKRFRATNGVAKIRLKVKKDRVSAHLGAPRRSESDNSDPRALELLIALREQHRFVYVPNARDTASDRFKDALTVQSRSLLREAMTQTGGGRPSKSVQTSQNSVMELSKNATTAVSRLARGLTSHAEGMFDEASVTVPLTIDDLIDVMAARAELRLSTGKHDINTVPAHEVGSGLQSLLFVGLMRAASSAPGRRVVLLLEEPETFLHPAAQRELSQALLDSQDLRFIASTHSAAILDEATAADVVLLRDHRVFTPSALDSTRSEIDSAFMSGQGAEAVFARSVLLVEGPGDLAVFEQLRRRLARLPHMSRAASKMAVVHVGGCERFAPWIRLLRGYIDQTNSEAIAWLALVDGDAATRLRKGLRHAGITVPDAVNTAMDLAKTTHEARDIRAHATAVNALNQAAEAAGLRAAVLPFDLEFALLSNVNADRTLDYATKFNVRAETGMELAQQLGSTFAGSQTGRKPKADWMRGHVAKTEPWEALDPTIRHVLRLWVEPALGPHALPQEIRAPRA